MSHTVGSSDFRAVCEFHSDIDAAVTLSVLVLGFAFAVILTARITTHEA